MDDTIKPGDQVYISWNEDTATLQEATFVKISGTGYRVVRLHDGVEMALESGDEMTSVAAIAAEVEEIERMVRENPIGTALPQGRARSFYERMGKLFDWSDEKIEELMAERGVQLDAAAQRTEHEG